MTTIKTIVRAEVSATIVANLKAGDVYKRIEKSVYGDSKLLFGVVTDIMASGEDIAITTLEFQSEYGASAEPVLKVFDGTAEVSIYPASLDEWDTAHAEAITKQERAVEEAAQSLARKESVLVRMRQVAAIASTSTAPHVAIEEVPLPEGDGA
jgi:hypothetical protein